MIDAVCGLLPPRAQPLLRDALVLVHADRPLATLLLLWPPLWALWFAANDFPPPLSLVAVTLGVWLAQGVAALGANLLQRRWPRLALAADTDVAVLGRFGPRRALALAGGLVLGLLVLAAAVQVLALAALAVPLAVTHLVARRSAILAPVTRAALRAWWVPLAFAAAGSALSPLCWLLYVGAIVFGVLQDSERALVTRAFDLHAGRRTLAGVFGDADRAIVAVLMAALLLALALAGTRAQLHWPWFVGVAVAGAELVRQWWQMRERAPLACLAALRGNNRVGLVLWFGLLFAVALR